MSQINFDTLVSELMTSPVHTLELDTKVDVAIQAMMENSCRRMPVLDRRGKLAGLVTLETARRAMPKGVSYLDSGEGEAEIPRVRQIMVHRLVTIGPNDSLARAAQLMMAHKFGALPVLDEDRQLVGILTESDIFRYLSKDLPPLAPQFS